MSRVMLVGAGTMLAIALFPLEAMASTPGTGTPGTTTEAQSESSMASAAPARANRYCVVKTFIGVHIAKKTCLTRDEWLKRGFDPLQ